MKEYHKIQTIFKRDMTNKGKLIEDMYSLPEFELLKDIRWIGTEKIDGTNIRILWDGKSVEFRGKTDNAQIPSHLVKLLIDTFTVHIMTEVFKDATNVCLYGEGYGMKIQKGGNYLANSVDFILFDIKIDKWWLTRYTIEGIAKELNIHIVPIINIFTLQDAVSVVKEGFSSLISENSSYMAEGLVLKPECELFSRNGNRIVTKIKHKDFKNK